MAYRASAFFKGNTRKPMPKAQVSGTTVTVLHTHVFAEAVGTTDVLELMPVPAGARVIGLDYASPTLTANLTLGWMSGTPGTPDGARTVGSAFVNAVALAATDKSASLVTLEAQGAAAENRSLGVKVGTAVAAGSDKLIVRVRLAF